MKPEDVQGKLEVSVKGLNLPPYCWQMPIPAWGMLDFPYSFPISSSGPAEWLEQVSMQKEEFFRERSDIFHAFDYAKEYSVMYKSLIQSKAVEVSNRVFDSPIPDGIVVYSFGAPSRNEMMGSSDADVAVYRAGKSMKELQFRDELVHSLQGYNFTKIDTPVWGTVQDIRCYMNTSVTEANQVFEAQFICGDREFHSRTEQLRESLYNTDIVARNLLFQLFFFDQYYEKKSSPHHINLKYCHGGIRDFLFPMWYAQLRGGIEKNLKTTALERGLTILCEENSIPNEDMAIILKYAGALAFIRDEVMRITPGDIDGLLSFQKAEQLYVRRPNLFQTPYDIMRLVEKSRQKVLSAKGKVWEGLRHYFAVTKPEEWNISFKKTLVSEHSELPVEFQHDEVINTVKIWNLNAGTVEQSGDYLQEMSQSDSWIVLASLLSCPHIPGTIIDSIVRRKGLTSGYEYLLEIAARNSNMETSTLEFILKDDSTEIRFKKPALKLAQERKLWPT